MNSAVDINASVFTQSQAVEAPLAARLAKRLFSATLLLSAMLLFCIEPMTAKMLLPLLGGVPAVWNTCLIFFQAAVLLGYLFSLGGAKLGNRTQSAVQIVAMGLALCSLPIVIDGGLLQRFTNLHPTLQALGLLTLATGLPFFVLSTIAPTLQRWYAGTRLQGAKDPYFLYAASNLGSFIGLLLYPVVLEPNMGLHGQAWLMRIAYIVVLGLVSMCAVVRLFWTTPAPCAPDSRRNASILTITSRQAVAWLALAAIPSAYLVAVTAHLTTDVAPAPFLWALPLSAYLLSFVVAFSSKPLIGHGFVVRYLPVPVAFVVYLIASGQGQPLSLIAVPAHVLTFFGACMLCHGELVKRRPTPAQLNEFYVVMSVGGLLGGVAVTLVAPHLSAVPIEYPVCLVLSLFARSQARPNWPTGPTRQDWLWPVAVLASTTGLGYLLPKVLAFGPASSLFPLVPLLLLFRLRSRASCFALCVAALLIGATSRPESVFGKTLAISRNFFGVLEVKRDVESRSVRVMHGTTLHGSQSLNPKLRREPMTYYARLGPAGDAFGVFDNLPTLPKRVAVIGLGAGTLATYAKPEERWTFFEINPAVAKMASDPALFTYLSDAFPGATNLRVVVGDARIELGKSQDKYGLLVVDAFSSDSIPVHLVTEEAVVLYASKLATSGIIAWHISNRYIKLAPILATAAAAHGFGALRRFDFPTEAEQAQEGARSASDWLVMSRDANTLARFPKAWQKIQRPSTRTLWTDDQNSVLSVIAQNSR